MSATKNYLQNCIEAQELTDLNLAQVTSSAQALADLAWAGGDIATWAPSADWLAITRQQLSQLQQALSELDTARGCLDYTDPVPATL